MNELPETTRVGRVALRVGDLDRMAAFYEDVVGLEPVERDGDRLALGVDGTGLLELRADPDAPERPADAAGLFHFAVRVPTREALGDALGRVRESWHLDGASDHLVSEALYLDDPEGNGVEIYRDRPRESWTETADGVEMATLPLDLDDLAADAAGRATVPAGTDVGHVHLEATDLDRAEGFYVDALGTNVRARYGADAAFVAAGDYHHHVGLNTWNGRSAPATGEHRGLDHFELLLPDEAALAAATARLRDAGATVEERDGVVAVADPDGIEIRLAVG